MPPLMQLPAYDYPRNALLNFAPINDAIDSNRANALYQRKIGIENERHQQKMEIENQKMGIENQRLKIQQENSRSQTNLHSTHADYYRAGADALRTKATPPDAAATPAADPLQGYGIDVDGNYIPPGTGPAQSASQYNFNPADATPMNRSFQPPMKLGGPVDDIDASMRLDEGGGNPRLSFGRPLTMDGEPAPARGVQVAQAGQGSPPTLMEQARQSTFGRAGQTADQVPGIVGTNGQTFRTDTQATREAAGQRAYEGATPEQQSRFNKLRQDQAIWTSAFGKPPRPGYYYGPNGQELAMSDRSYKGDREAGALIDMNLKVIDEAHKSLMDQSFGYSGRTLSGAMGYGENARAFSDLKGAATNIAFALSGKSVSNDERKEFNERYAPKPGDSDATINHKVGRMKQFFDVLKKAQAKGYDGQQAWALANSAALGTAPAPAGARANPAPANPAVDRLKNKYGLE